MRMYGHLTLLTKMTTPTTHSSIQKQTPSSSQSINHKMKGVIYIGHIPFGFFETQIRKFFSQFGGIRRMALKRSKKNGHCKGYGFLQFKNPEVAEIAAGAMNGYLLFGRSLVCSVLDEEKVHPLLFKKMRALKTRSQRRQRAAAIHNRNAEATLSIKRIRRNITRKLQKSEKLRYLGIDYTLEDLYPAELSSFSKKDDKTAEKNAAVAV
ncbi:Rna recognition motif-containing protein [Cardiosporidium cionae]|uniref:Rna recognition motif-containing protein n=1 Tax=Cardiosporidium cionae TaxID=476202 RepID=A0ABQ7JC61_9APIC|nr:Rna recognition motif-containing protein [Cardiosporidium cionae]|eukprot:KAF8821597.1 Rna recognition motif-containing protein [Cardiosporidium cionae]